jgi:hypothetical protein
MLVTLIPLALDLYLLFSMTSLMTVLESFSYLCYDVLVYSGYSCGGCGF